MNGESPIAVCVKASTLPCEGTSPQKANLARKKRARGPRAASELAARLARSVRLKALGLPGWGQE